MAARYRMRLPPSLEEVLRDARDTAELDVLQRALRVRTSELAAALLPTAQLRDLHGGDRASIGRDPLALSFITDAMGAPDADTGEPCPSGNVRGGMGEVGRLLAEAAVEAGARIQLGVTVDGCIVEGGRVRGIRLHDGTEVRSRVVLSNRDPKATILGMLPADAVPPHLARRVAAIPTGVSCYKFLAVLSELP
jgi:phytoene dehydrogenase-like protein